MKRSKISGMRRFTSVRSRLTLWNVLALTVALTAVSVQIRYSVGANILGSIDQELSSMVRYASRMNGRRVRGRGPGPGQFGNPFPPPSFSGEVRQMDNSIGIPSMPGAPPLVAAAPPYVPQRPNESITGAGANVAPPTPQPGPARIRRGEGIPNSPATRVFFNGPRTILNEPPWDMAGYSRSLTDSTDVYATLRPADHGYRMLTHSSRGRDGGSVVIQCTFPLAEMERAVHSLDITLLTTIPLALLIAGLGGAFLTDRAMRPVRHITRTAEMIGAEDLSRRLPVETNDEFSQLAGTFNAMLARLETSFIQQRRFTADASHELKSPLTVIKANASLALRTPRSAEEYVRRIEAIDRASNHMRVLVDDLLLLARADEGRLAVHKEHISITEILKDVIDSTNRPDSAPLTTDFPDSPLMLDGDRHELMRVFGNLIDNALRYTPITGKVTVTARDEGVAVCVTVSDTGDGIPAEHIDHLGERFYRVDASRARTHGGSGLGLAICRSIVEAHHGTIIFRSARQIGTTVAVTLPTANSDIV